jgi:hypothetical protein
MRTLLDAPEFPQDQAVVADEVAVERVPNDGLDTAPTAVGLAELLLKNPERVDQLNRKAVHQRELFSRLLLIAEVGYLSFAFMMVLILNLAPAAAYPHSLMLRMPPTYWSDGTSLSLPLAYAIGLVLAACVCLPTFYFHSLLAGIRMTWLQIVSLVGKGMASSAIMLLGILPIYVAAVLGLVVLEAPTETLQWTLKVGLLLPFVAGLWGLRALYIGVMDMVDNPPLEWRCRRRCFFRRLVLAWTAVYTAVVPIMIYRLWEYFAEHLRML